MPVIIVHETQHVIGVFTAEPEWVDLGDIEGREGCVGGDSGHYTEGCELVVRGNAARRLVGNELRDVLVAVVEVEEVVSPRDALHPKRAGGDWLRRIPSEGEVNGVVGGSIEPLDAEVAVVNEAVVGVGDGHRGRRPSHRLKVFHAPPHTVVLHHDVRRAARPRDGAVLAVVGDAPDASGGLYERLVSVQVELRCELFLRRVGDNAPYP